MEQPSAISTVSAFWNAFIPGGADVGETTYQNAEGNQVAEIVFVPTGEHLSIIEHTDVDPSLKGQGVGKQLVAKVVEKMRQEQRKIIPLCPFAKHEFDNTREYDDIRA